MFFAFMDRRQEDLLSVCCKFTLSAAEGHSCTFKTTLSAASRWLIPFIFSSKQLTLLKPFPVGNVTAIMKVSHFF